MAVFGIALLFGLSSIFPGSTRGDELDDLEKDLQSTRGQIQEYEGQLSTTKAAIEEAKRQVASYSGALQSYSGQLAYARAQLEQTQLELEEKKLELENTEVKVREATLTVQYHERLLRGTVRDFYKRSFGGNLPFLFSNESIGDSARTATYRSRVSDNFQQDLLEIVGMLDQLLKQKDQLAADKENFEKEQEELAARQSYLQRQIASSSAGLANAQGQQSRLSQTQQVLEQQIGELTQKEQQLLTLKSAVTNSTNTVGEIDVGLQKVPPAPSASHYSIWTYGHPHQVGMSQYGAYGRAIAGQAYDQILHAYFSNVAIEHYWNDDDTIPVQGHGDMSMREYLYRLGEMPEGWGSAGGYEALKAQVVAARTYALNYIYFSWSNGQLVEKDPAPICTTQSCQVIGNPKTGKWKQAVDETEGLVLLHEGKPITAWYSASAGGFVLSSEEQWGGARPWALGKNDFDPQGFAYDGGKYINPPSGSPYYPWIANGNDGSNYWLPREVMEDLLNATLLPASKKSKLYNPEYNYKTCAPSGGTADGLTAGAVREILVQEGIAPVVGLVEVQNIGQNTKATQSLTIIDQYGTRQVDAQLFRDAFKRRAPGCYDIPTKRFEVKQS